MFKVGDIVVGTSENRYNYTGAGSVCRVVSNLIDSDEDLMRVEVMTSAPDYCRAGDTFAVIAKYFELQRSCFSDEDFEKLFE